MTAAKEIVTYWLETVGEAGWFAVSEATDNEIRSRFGPFWQEARAGGLAEWGTTAQGALAYLILTDQFPRNMFRGDPRAFATDALARVAADAAIAQGFDLQVTERSRAFFYLPFEHSEAMADQDRAVDLMQSRLPADAGYGTHALAHREVIRRFGRFPFRNAALGRKNTEAEDRFLAAGGYAAVAREFGG